ncbi:hypothetical protein F5X71_07540 [Nocardia brasiliensis]|uniref:Uncharacterized protein n=1 Tax=Nocardia brasiliensis TaxID=37326 RepID=A0A6G9XML9_NOCBR|nr:hypothetical protein [Nocardia brasiliensis]QIS02192.1 hypothetical protein F5X71_07540 [Nocardia brasiliensis]
MRTESSDRTTTKSEGDTGLLAVPAVLGLGMLIAAFATLDRIPGWSEEYGAILVYLACFLYMSIAGRLTWWGVDTLFARARNSRRGSRR